MTSQDVIHSFSVPAFRIKQDVLPGSYTDASGSRRPRPAYYHLFYCRILRHGPLADARPRRRDGAERLRLAWLRLGRAGVTSRLTPHGRETVRVLRLHTNATASNAIAPTLAGLYGRRCGSTDGSTVTRRRGLPPRVAILTRPAKDRCTGYGRPDAELPRAVLSEEQVAGTLSYIKSGWAARGPTTPAADEQRLAAIAAGGRRSMPRLPKRAERSAGAPAAAGPRSPAHRGEPKR